MLKETLTYLLYVYVLVLRLVYSLLLILLVYVWILIVYNHISSLSVGLLIFHILITSLSQAFVCPLLLPPPSHSDFLPPPPEVVVLLWKRVPIVF